MKRELSNGGNINNCQNNHLEAKIELNLPQKYAKNVFCAQNPTEPEGTCPGDSGKYTEPFVFLLKVAS